MNHIQAMGSRLQSAKTFFTRTSAHPPLSMMRPLRFSALGAAKGMPDMPVLEAAADRGKGLVDFRNTAFFSVQHILRTNVPLFKHLIQDLNANPNNIYLSGKGYSDSSEAEMLLTQLGIHYFKLEKQYETTGQYARHLRFHLKYMWRHFTQHLKQNDIQRIIVIDEGGHSLETMPDYLCFHYSMAGIEQTRGGLYSPSVNTLPFPLIEVASCALKRHLESPLITEAIIHKLHKALGARLDIHSDTVFGVIGNGAIGSSVTRYLLNRGYTVAAYDENNEAFQGLLDKNLYRVQNVHALIARAGYILGCTGKDTLKGAGIISLLEACASDKKLISCTSEDKEFYSILKDIGKQKSIELNNLGEVVCQTEAGGKLTLVNAGFPVNFDQSGESVPAEDIQLTRALMLGACIQAGRCASKPEGGAEMALAPRFQLDSTIQQFIAREFEKCQSKNRYSDQQWALSQNLTWINHNSGGKAYLDKALSERFWSLPAASPCNRGYTLRE